MKKSLLLILLLSFEGIIAQTQSKVDNYPLKASDLVLFSFGMDNPLSIGTISDSGELDFKFPENLNFITDEMKSNFMSDTAFTLFSKCDNSYDILTEEENSKAVNAGYISFKYKRESVFGVIIYSYR